jgi:peptide/nickel transport system substrate-binding protein
MGQLRGNFRSASTRTTRRQMLAQGGAVVTGAAGLLAVGCGDDDDDDSEGNGQTPAGSTVVAQPKQGGVLRLPANADPPTLDPHLSSAAGTYNFVNFIYSRLLTFDTSEGSTPYSYQLKGDLAASREQPDELTYTFKIKPGIKWQQVAPVNGRDLVAQDVVYALERLRTPDPKFTNAFILGVVDKITAPDPSTVSITLKSKFAPFLDNLAHQNALIVPKEIIDAEGDARRTAVGTGPFILKSAQTGSKYVLERNPAYHDGAPHIDGIEYLIMPDSALQLAGLRAGEVDMIGVDPDLSKDLERTEKGVGIKKLDGTSGVRLAIWNQSAPFNDVRVRQAVHYGIDRQAIISTARSGYARPMSIFGQNLSQWDIPESEIKKYTTPDVGRAKQLLEQAGQGNGFDTTWEAAPPTHPLNVYEMVQQQLKAIKVNLKIETVEYAAWQQHANTQKFTAFISPIRGFSDPDNILYRNYHPSSPQRWVQLGNEEQAFKTLIEKQREELNAEVRKRLVQDAVRAALDLALVPGIYDPQAYYAHSARLKGWAPHGVDGQLEMAKVWLDG